LLLAESPLHFVLLLLLEQNYTFQLSSFWGSRQMDIQDAWDIKSTAADMYTWMKTNLDALSASNPSALQKALAMATSVQLANPVKPGGVACNFDMGLAWQIFNKKPESPTIIAKDGATSKGGCCGWLGMVQENVQTGAPAMGLALLLNCDDMDPGKTGTSILQQIAELF
jgi:hypothetical protein